MKKNLFRQTAGVFAVATTLIAATANAQVNTPANGEPIARDASADARRGRAPRGREQS